MKIEEVSIGHIKCKATLERLNKERINLKDARIITNKDFERSYNSIVDMLVTKTML